MFYTSFCTRFCTRVYASIQLLSYILAALFIAAQTQAQDFKQIQTQAQALYAEGNYREALAKYEVLLTNPEANLPNIDRDLSNALACLVRLNEQQRFDALVESAVKAHSNSWLLLWSAGNAYKDAQHVGFVLGGDFQRGYQRGEGRYVNAQQRDRVRAMQLYQQAWDSLKQQTNQSNNQQNNLQLVLTSYANAINDQNYRQSWRLQLLTDTTVLPDYEEGYGYDNRLGAPVDSDGNIVVYAVPTSFAEAINDGERWRFLLAELDRLDASNSRPGQWQWIEFLWREYGVQTVAESLNRYYYVQPDPDENQQAERSLLDLDSLADDETIARLANGIHRLQLPKDYQFILYYQQFAEQGGYQVYALEKLAEIYENRRQWNKAADYWRRAIAISNGRRQFQQQRLDQIVGAWAQFEPLPVQAQQDTEQNVNLRFRNANSVKLAAYRINTAEYLRDLKNYLKSNPRELEWEKVNLPGIGFYLLDKGKNYRGNLLRAWVQELSPAADHQDRHQAIALPDDLHGTYLLEATVSGGNTSYIVVWNTDAVIVERPMQTGTYYFLADGETGKPLANKKLNLFGFRTEWKDVNVAQRIFNRNAREMEIYTKELAVNTDSNGQVIVDQQQLLQDYQWLVHTEAKDNNFAYIGFQRIWYGNRYYWQDQQTKSFVITNQPVYRPGQVVDLKAWINTASYTPKDANPHANQTVELRIYTPQGKTIANPHLTTDTFGGVDYQLTLPEIADLGVYGVQIVGYTGAGNFRVEEYKKPEYEVLIDKPNTAAKLGDTIHATVKANYYFGAPVTHAKVKVKVLRYEHAARWFPTGRWDWLYGKGYWWFACDMQWYPGWRDWGISAPRYSWLPYYPPQPEMVMDTEYDIGSDGSVDIAIDTTTAKLLHGDKDHRYNISVEVIDQSRRSVYASGDVLVARKPFQVFAWVDRGFYQLGDTVQAQFRAQTLDETAVTGDGTLELLRIHYDDNHQPTETLVQRWNLNTDNDGNANLSLSADAIGQHRLRYSLRDKNGNVDEGGYVFNVVGDRNNKITSDEDRFRFNELELIAEQSQYAPGDTVKLLVNSRRENAHVLLFERPQGNYPLPKQLTLTGNSQLADIVVTNADHPNFFVEAVTVFEGKVYSQVKEIAVPPRQSELQVTLTADKADYKPGETAQVEISLRDQNDKPFVGSTAITVYDKALDYIAGDVTPPNIRDYFWQWKRQHTPTNQHSLNLVFGNMALPNAITMQSVGVFGDRVLGDAEMDKFKSDVIEEVVVTGSLQREVRAEMSAPVPASAPMAKMAMADANVAGFASRSQDSPENTVTVRTDFADAVYWNANVQTDSNGKATVSFKMPDNLTTWKASVWSMGLHTEVGQGQAELITKKNLLLRLQAPRFFVEKDEVVLSANVHNYLPEREAVNVRLELDGEELQLLSNNKEASIQIDANGEQRVNWRVKVAKEGMASIRMLALGDAESDAVALEFPVYVHGQLITQSFSGALNKNQNNGVIEFTIPAQRRPEQSHLELRYSPTLAGAMVDALPYLVDYPYGCTEQTLSRFLPTVLVNKVLTETGIDLDAIKNKQSNLNAQEIGNDRERAAQWGNQDDWRWRISRKNPVFDSDEVEAMVNTGLLRLHGMQLSDGGWGWFSGWGEHSYPHTTAHVVRGLLVAKNLGLQVNEDNLQRGINWLRHYQDQELQKLNNAATETKPYKRKANNVDALVAMVLGDAEQFNQAMLDYLFKDRLDLAVYSQSLLALTLHNAGRTEQRDQVRRNIEQYLIRDPENQTAYLNLNNGGYWWYWYGSEFEAHAYYLKLLALTDPNSDIAPALVKYLLNNRKHANYWNSTRDTALVIEAMSDYLIASGEAKPDAQVDLILDGKLLKTVDLNQDNLFSFDNKLILEGAELTSGKHTLQLQKRGSGPLYYNAYLSNFSMEDKLKKQGLELKVERKYYKLEKIAAQTAVAGSQGQALQQETEKYRRIPVNEGTEIQSGDLIEIELLVDSKNDYEYILIEDMKAAGFEPLEVRSGYIDSQGKSNELGAYVEYRDNRVAFFARQIARGKHNLSYRMKAEIPGKFSALPTKVSAMYAPELKANSDEENIAIVD